MYSIVSTAIIQGTKSIPISVEADVSDGMPMFEMVGFLSSEVKEAKERVRTALRNAGYQLPPKRITINFTPADIRKSGAGFDLPVALSILAALGRISPENLKNTFVIGEVGLNGKLQPVRGVLPMVAEAKERGIHRFVLPMGNAKEAALVSEIEVFEAESLLDAIACLRGERKKKKYLFNMEETQMTGTQVDFADIRGQNFLKRACEVAVCGMHNLLMVGPPGAGKTMMAMRIPTILPPLDASEQMELSKIYSVSGLFAEREHLMCKRPFRAPHHTISLQGLTGGGVIPKPGEISLAHKGVLFLDELPEFRKNVLEILRQPMEEKKVRLARSHGTYEFAADFMLVAAMNPCRCGYYPDMQKCRCTQKSIEQYLGQISQPLIDRIDVCVEAPKIEFEDLIGSTKEESSAEIRKRVKQVWQIQQSRFTEATYSFNSQISAADIKKYCTLNPQQESYMKEMYEDLNLTARSYHKILKVARTIADMEQEDIICDRHLKEAVCYRSLDRKFWERP